MDDLEFKTRAFSNPLDDCDDFRRAAESDPDRRLLLDELTQLDSHIKQTMGSVEVPSGLQKKLLKHASPQRRPRLPHVLAASLVVSTVLGAGILINRPNAQDLALRDALVDHLYQEAPRYADAAEIRWSEVEPVIHAAGARMASQEEIESLHLTFANYCGLGGAQRGAHLVAQGEYGPVSIIFLKNTPVTRQVKLRDSRFKGRILPLAEGNIAVIGEKQEPLEHFEEVLLHNFQWET